MKRLKLAMPLLFFLSILLFTACGGEVEPPLLELEGTQWVNYNNDETVLIFYDTSWTREVEGVPRIFEGTYDYSNPPNIIYYQLDEDGNVTETFVGEVVYENTLTFGGDRYIRR